MPIDQARTQEVFRNLSRMLGQVAKKPLPERVHQFRTSARRVETLLEVLSPDGDRKQRKLLKDIARARRRAGRVRDVDVQMAALRKVKIGREAQRKTRLLEILAAMRGKREKKLVRAVDGDSGRKLQKRLARTLAALQHAPMTTDAPGEEASFPAATPVFEPVAVALQRFAHLARTAGALTVETLHAYRMQCKRIRYLAEMAGEDPEAKQAVEHLKRIQDVGGDWHDWDTLTRTAEETFSHGMQSALVAALRNVASAKFLEAKRVVAEERRHLLAMHRALLARTRLTAKAPAASSRPRPVAAQRRARVSGAA